VQWTRAVDLQRFIEAMGGTIRADAGTYGRGTSIEVTLAAGAERGEVLDTSA